MPIRSALATTLLAATLATAFGPATAAPLRYTFDSDAQGWTAASGGDLSHQAGGGKHGGYLQIADASDDDFVVLPPAEALGDWHAYLGGKLQFAARNANGDTPDWAPFGTVTLSNGVQTVQLDIAPDNSPPADGHWHQFSTTLTPELWGPDLAAVLANVTSLTIKLEFHAGVTEVVDFDSFAVKKPPKN